MLIKLKPDSNKVKAFIIAAAVLFCCLLLGSSYTFAMDYKVWGQVQQVSHETAADESIADADLTGSACMYVRVQIYDQGTAVLLGEGDAGANGQFTVEFTSSTVPPGLDIECRVYRFIDHHLEPLSEARTGINSFAGIAQFNQKKLLVLTDEDLDYEGDGFCGIDGVGIIFTKVGDVEIPYISQDTTLVNRKVAGLADFTLPVPPGITDGETRAAELQIPVFQQAPFATQLKIYGEFGNPGTGVSCGGQIDFYQVKIKKINETNASIDYDTDELWMDEMKKVRTTVQVFPIFQVENITEKIGPYTGTLVSTSTEIGGLYRVNRPTSTLFTTTVYSYADMRVQWNSHKYTSDGLYEISLIYYRMVGGTLENPDVELIPDYCFYGGPIPPTTALHKLIIRVNNQSLQVGFDNIYLKDTTVPDPEPAKYFKEFDGSGNPVNDTIANAFDFNKEGLCSIMHLLGQYEVEIHFHAYHDGEYMRYYSLKATANDTSLPVVNFLPVIQESFTTHTTATNPRWAGDTSRIESNKSSFSEACAYIIDLIAGSRLHNGTDYVEWAHPRRTYYIDPN
jgi:hypothetical protein